MTDVISKIQKLRRLAESSNEHEALVAKKKADELMKKHNLSESDIGDYSKQWQQDLLSLIESYHLGDKGQILFRAIIEECNKSEYCDNYWYQQGVYEGVKGNLVRVYGKILDNDDEETKPFYVDDEEYQKLLHIRVEGFVTGDYTAYDYV